MFRREEFVVDNMTKKTGHVVSDNVLIIMQISVIKALEELKFIFERTFQLLKNNNEVFISDYQFSDQRKCKSELGRPHKEWCEYQSFETLSYCLQHRTSS